MGRPEDYLEFVSPQEIRINGHRVWIQDVLFCHLDERMGPRELAKRFPSLAMEEIEAVLAYHAQHRPEVDAYLQAEREYLERSRREYQANPPPGVKRLLEPRAKLATEGKL